MPTQPSVGDELIELPNDSGPPGANVDQTGLQSACQPRAARPRVLSLAGHLRRSARLSFGNDRVFKTSPGSSHARRAWFNPAVMNPSSAMLWASVLIAILMPASRASRACSSDRSRRFGLELIS